MARRVIRTDRLIVVLGVVVLALGVVSLWAVSRGAGLSFGPPTATARALQQVREQMGPSGEVRYAEAGEGRALCGYAGRKGDGAARAFVSRPNRILFSDDPLSGEFRELRQRFCPGFLTPPPSAAP